MAGSSAAPPYSPYGSAADTVARQPRAGCDDDRRAGGSPGLRRNGAVSRAVPDEHVHRAVRFEADRRRLRTDQPSVTNPTAATAMAEVATTSPGTPELVP